MTIANRDLHKVYESAKSGELGEILQGCADMADCAYDAMADYALCTTRLALDGGDNAENFICEAFALACISNKVNWRIYAGLTDMEGT